MILMPGWRQIYLETGLKPVVLCSHQFGDTLDGVSYIEPWIENLEWYGDIAKAKKMAEKRYGWCIVPKWWDDPTHIPVVRKWDEVVNLDSHGRHIIVPAYQWDSYMMAQWRSAGFKDSEMGKWPLVFDRRDSIREELLIGNWNWTSSKPTVLMNLSGNSSRFPFRPEVEKEIYAIRKHANVIDISGVKAFRVYDMLGLFERSSLLITADTSTLHLASACKIPMVAYIADGGGGSVVNGNTLLKTRYSNAINGIRDLKNILANPLQWGNVSRIESLSL